MRWLAHALFCVPMRVLRSGRERGRGRGTQRVPPAGVCAWCKRAGRGADECTWKASSHQDKFTCAADVRSACAGHMIASVWDGTRVRRQNKERLQRYRSASIAGCSSHVPQHDWAEHVLDACKYEELLAAANAGSSGSGSSSDHWSDSDSSSEEQASEEQATSVDAAATHRDWGTKYAGVDTLPPGSILRQSACEFFVAVWAGIACRNSQPAYRSLVSGRWIRPPPRRCYARAKVISSVVSARRSFDSEFSTHLGICMLTEFARAYEAHSIRAARPSIRAVTQRAATARLLNRKTLRI